MPTREEQDVFAALQNFAQSVTSRMTGTTRGEPEDQLRGPFEALMEAVGRTISRPIVPVGEVRLAGRLGKPDYAITIQEVLIGYVELKAPGVGVNTNRFTGHNRQQSKRFAAIPNLIYCDGNSWRLYRDGEGVGQTVRLAGDVATDGRDAVTEDNAASLLALLSDFLSWQPIIPRTRRGVDLPGLAKLLAPLCGMLRADVLDALQHPESPLVQLARDWRQLLFPDADDEHFADAYAQTVTFALLLARSEGADPLTLTNAESALATEHSLLSRALLVLTDQRAQAEISASLQLLVRVIGAMPGGTMVGPDDPWLYFYEDFLAVYDPQLRRDIGAYYTPVEVVRAQVRMVDDLLTNRLGKPLGFADQDVVTLDPAVGTGTYLLGVIDHALQRVEAEQGPGAVPGQATELAKNLYGFEILVGPFAVSELRVSRALQDRGATLPEEGTHVYLTDTLESPNTPPATLPFYLQPIAEQHARALQVKATVPVIVCLGNPPYDRHEAADGTNRARTGGWVRWGDEGTGGILRNFTKPAIDAGHGGHLKNLYNLYVYFWRWALWKVFEHSTSVGSGVVSFITASSYLDGDAFCGVREHMRKTCDEIWILDLGGEGRGTRQTENVFAIQTPVAIAVTLQDGEPQSDVPAMVHYAVVEGTREEKLAALDAINDLGSIVWQDCPQEWQAPFRPAGEGKYFDWPLLTDLFPWQHSGVQTKRNWPIGPSPQTLNERWRGLLRATDRANAFAESSDRRVTNTYRPLPIESTRARAIAELPQSAETPELRTYSFRSFDRQWIIADARLISRPRPELWIAHGDKQVYVTTLLNHPLGGGPALTAAAELPDLHHFRGSYGGADVMPLYRDPEGTEPNILPGLLEALAKAYGRPVAPEDFLSYVYGILAQPYFTERYAEELATRELRVPIARDADLFEQVRGVGAKLLWLHTYGERYVPRGRRRGRIPQGAARCTHAVPGDPESYPEAFDYDEELQILHVGDGQFAPVAPAVYNFDVSGLKVVQSWLGYRMKNPRGRKSSPLDDIRPERWTGDFTTELLELLWILEETIAGYPAQAKLLSAIVRKGTIKL